MKIKPKNQQAPPTVKTINLQQLADDFGKENNELDEKAKAANAALTKNKDQIKKFAADKGQPGENNPRERLVEGHKWTVGYLALDPQTKFNEESAIKILGAKAAQYMTERIDPAKIERAVLDQKISKKDFLAMFDTAKDESKRIIVRRKQ